MVQEAPLILVVDDQPKNLQLVAAVLKSSYRLLIADSAEKAIRAAQEKHPNLILLDVMMPEMSGYEATAILKGDPSTKDIPIIFLTARGDTEDMIQGFQAGGVDYILKPFVRQELLQRVQTHVKLDIQRREILEKSAQLNHLNEEKTKLLSVLSHDLRNLIGGNMGLLQILESDFDELTPEEAKEFIGMIASSNTQTFNLMDDLLSWLKSQNKELRMHPVPILVHPLVDEVVALFNNHLRQKRITIELDCPGGVVITADQNMFETVMRNLLNNAIKFSRSDSVIRLAVEISDTEAHFSVQDQGVGMSAEKIARLWTSAFESEPGTAGERGTGVGLNLCKTYVENHGGRIWVESELGVGTTFHFTIPDGHHVG
jgi:two-component system, sensor histidine kinase and response regulator